MRQDFALDVDARLFDGAPDQPRIQEIAGGDQGRGRQAERHLNDPVLDKAVLGDQHDQCASRPKMDELDML